MNRIVQGNLLRLEGCSSTLDIRTETAGRTAVMRLCGSATAELEADLADEILALVSAGMDIRLDCAGLDYISSTAQKKLMDIQLQYMEPLGRTLVICGVSRSIYALFQSSRLETQLNILRET